MQIKIGEKIRELRHRDGRTQDDLATAIGVTCQAISRWEANGGYPDMETVPAIANYFHVSIDELFGYSGEREDKLKDILSKADDALNAQGDMTDCIAMLRAAADEFPSEPKILLKLGYALSQYGWQKHGARSYTKEGSDYVYEDIEYSAQNIYWQEMLQIFEKIIDMDIPPADRDAVVHMTVHYYAKMGHFDKAKALAEKQNSLIVSRECLIPDATEEEERDKYYGEAIIALLGELKTVVMSAVGTNTSVYRQGEGRRIFADLAHMYESVFCDGRFGIVHNEIGELYFQAAFYEARFCGESLDLAEEYFSRFFDHYKAYDALGGDGEYRCTAPLVSKVSFPTEGFKPDDRITREGWLDLLPDEFIKRLRKNERYANLFN